MESGFGGAQGNSAGTTGGTFDSAKHLAEQAAEQAKARALGTVESQRGELAHRLQAFADKLGEIGGQEGFEGQLVGRASEYLKRTASSLEGKDTHQLLSEIGDQVRRRPGLFFAGAAALGFLGGRLVRR